MGEIIHLPLKTAMNIVVHVQIAAGTAAGTPGHYCPYYMLGLVPRARDIARDRTDEGPPSHTQVKGREGHPQLCKPTLKRYKENEARPGENEEPHYEDSKGSLITA